MNYIICFLKNTFSMLFNISPNPTFLSDVAAFEAVFIAFLVPLSIDIISKISERYNSEVIIRTFENRRENKILPPFPLINTIIAIVLRFFVESGVDSLYWKIAAWLILIVFISTSIVIWRVTICIKTFISDTKAIVDLFMSGCGRIS